MGVSKLHRDVVLEQNAQSEPPELSDNTGAFWVAEGEPTLPYFTDSDGESYQLARVGAYPVEPWTLLVVDAPTGITWDIAQYLPEDPEDGTAVYFACKIRFGQVANSVWAVREVSFAVRALYFTSEPGWFVYNVTGSSDYPLTTDLVAGYDSYGIDVVSLGHVDFGTEFTLTFEGGSYVETGNQRLTGWIEILPHQGP